MTTYPGVPGELMWDYVRAGEYESSYYCNGYKYAVQKDDDLSNTWHAYYVWYPLRKKMQWKPLRGNFPSSFTTKRAAQAACATHNKHPRTKWKYDGAVDIENCKNYQERHKLGKLRYVRCNSDGKIPENFASYNARYLDPSTMYFPISTPDENKESPWAKSLTGE